MLPESPRYENPRIPVEFSYAGQKAKGFLTEVTGKKYWWFLHSDDKYLVDALIYENKKLRWLSGKQELQEQMDYFRATLAAWYK